MPQERFKTATRVSKPRFEIILGVIFDDFSVFLLKTSLLKTGVFVKRVFDVFFLCLERFKPMKYSKNAVGSFKNRVYKKSEKIDPRSDLE